MLSRNTSQNPVLLPLPDHAGEATIEIRNVKVLRYRSFDLQPAKLSYQYRAQSLTTPSQE